MPAAGHVFQNPRLSIAGLTHYYGDVYDGLGADSTEQVFGIQGAVYVRRARALVGLGQPHRRLDVGGGHGHFAAVVRETFPGVRIEGLDLSESIDDAGEIPSADEGWYERNKSLDAMLSRLTKRQRELCELIYRYGMSNADASKELGMTPKLGWKIHNAALDRLRKSMAA